MGDHDERFKRGFALLKKMGREKLMLDSTTSSRAQMMKRFSRRVVAALVAAWGLAAAHGAALSQPPAAYPTKPVRIVVVFAPGGGLDIIGRLVADRLTRNWGQPVIVDNRPGAGGNIATALVAKATADGYTLLLTSNNHNINAFIYRKPGYDPRKDFAPVVQLTAAPSLLITRPDSAYRSLKDVVSAARSAPGKLSYGSAGSGSPTHIAGEMLKKALNIDLAHIPYKGGGLANQDVLGGQIPLAMAAMPPAMPLIQAGRLRALVVTAERRWPGLPDVPTVVESGYPKSIHVTWIGIVAPAGTPAPVIARLNKEIAAVLSSLDVRERIAALGAEPVGKPPFEFEAMLSAEREATGKLASELGLKVD